MKTAVILYILVFLSTAASAEIYRWEDANGINFTDDSASIPEQYREKPVAEADQQSGDSGPQVGRGVHRQNLPAANQEKQAAEHQDNLDRHRRAAETKKQQQINAKNLQDTLQSLAKFIVIGLMLGLCLFTVWIVTIVDIVRSGFVTPASKAVWLLLVVFLPLLGMLFYMILGSNRKRDPLGGRETPPRGVLIRQTRVKRLPEDLVVQG